jgi:hypothetical protein
MKLSDIVSVGFDNQDRLEADQWQQYMDAKNQGSKTVNFSKNKNKSGFLGHLAVERAIERLNLPYTSSRTQKFLHGDPYDIAFEDDFIEVKSLVGDFSEQYFFNKKLFVFDHHQRKGETHYCWVEVDRDFIGAHIYGVMTAEWFYQIAQPGVAQANRLTNRALPYHYIISRELRPLNKYLLHVV